MALRCIASLAVIVAIASAALSSGAAAAEDRYAIVMPGRYEVEPSQVAPDMMLSIVAIVNALRGERDLGKGAGEVHVASDASIVAGDRLEQARPFTYEGFALASVRLHRLEPSAYAAQGRRLMGVLQFVDAAALRAETAFQIDYTTGGKGLTIHELKTMAITPLDARVIMRALPLAEGTALLKQRPATIGAFLQRTLDRKAALPQNNGDWMLVAISPDRVLAGDRLEIEIGSKAGEGGAVAATPVAFDYSGFAVAAMPWRATGRPAVANIYLHTDMHSSRSDGRRLLGTVQLTGGEAAAPSTNVKPVSPNAQQVSPAPSAPAAPQAAGGWRLDDDANPTQLAFSTPERADDPELLLVCDRPNNELHVLYRKLSSDDVEAATDRPDTLAAQVGGAGTSLTLAGFVSRAPEATAVGYDILVTDNSAAALTAPDAKWTLPGMTIAAPLTDAAVQFVRNCPKVGTATESMTWRRRINLAAGYAIDLPLGFYRLASADRSGRFYREGPGNGTLQISNVVNQDDMTPREALKRMTQDKDVVTKVTKSAAGKDALTITGTRGSRAMFLKAILTCEKSRWAIVRLEYDAAARGEVEPLLGRIEQSFTPQGEYEGQAACE